MDTKTNKKLTPEQQKTLQLMQLAAQAILKEDKKLFEELAKY